MPYDQSGNEFLGQARGFLQNLLAWVNEEGTESEHPGGMAPGPDADQRSVNQPMPQNPKNAAGMLLLAPDGRALFVRRAKDARDHAGTWSIPGGMTEGDELPWDTAMRELTEEVGDVQVNDGQLLDHNVMGDLGFTTYGGKVGDNFAPILNDEHDGYMWANPDEAPQPMHPGLKATLDFAMDPLTEKGEKIMRSMKDQYGSEKGEQVFYASKNAGKLSGVDNLTGSQNPFNANIDALPPQPSVARAAGGQRPPTPDAWGSPRWDSTPAPQARPSGVQVRPVQPDAWSSPQWDAVGGGGPGTHTSAPVGGALTHGTPGGSHSGAPAHADVKPPLPRAAIGRPQASLHYGQPGDATAGGITPSRGGGAGGWGHGGLTPPTQRGANDLAKRFVLRDTMTGKDYAIDQPLSSDFTPGRPAKDAWANTDPTKPVGSPQLPKPPVPGPPQASQMRGGTSQPVAQRGDIGQPALPGAPPAGPKVTQSVRAQYPDGSVDERKITRPSPMANPGASTADWGSPRWDTGDQGWPNAKSAGPSPIGGTAGRSATMSGLV